MVEVCFYFQVHQPRRLKNYSYFDIGHNHEYYDDFLNQKIINRVAQKCYLPTNQLILDLLKKHNGKFKVAFSITGTAIEQFQHFSPEVLQSFQEIAKTGYCEFLNETYFHSLSSVFSEQEFLTQVCEHRQLIENTFGLTTNTFRNTELIYNNKIAELVGNIGYNTILLEGAEKFLGWRNANYLYTIKDSPNIRLLLRNYRLSDDIAFRFSDTSWVEFPLYAKKFASWVKTASENAQTLNLFMDYETFGEHQWKETGIFDFLRHLVDMLCEEAQFHFSTPSEIAKKIPPLDTIDIPSYTSWADEERDLTAWSGNELQQDACQSVYSLERLAKSSNDKALLHTWQNLLTSDHVYYMCTKYHQDGDVHKYFSPYHSPYEAYTNFQNVVADLRHTLQKINERSLSLKFPTQ